MELCELELLGCDGEQWRAFLNASGNFWFHEMPEIP
jgi:hypothetical protein